MEHPCAPGLPLCCRGRLRAGRAAPPGARGFWGGGVQGGKQLVAKSGALAESHVGGAGAALAGGQLRDTEAGFFPGLARAG